MTDVSDADRDKAVSIIGRYLALSIGVYGARRAVSELIEAGWAPRPVPSDTDPMVAAATEAARWGYTLSTTEAAHIAEAVLATRSVLSGEGVRKTSDKLPVPSGDNAALIDRLRRADDPSSDSFVPHVGHLFGEAADALEAVPRTGDDDEGFQDQLLDQFSTAHDDDEAVEGILLKLADLYGPLDRLLYDDFDGEAESVTVTYNYVRREFSAVPRTVTPTRQQLSYAIDQAIYRDINHVTGSSWRASLRAADAVLALLQSPTDELQWADPEPYVQVYSSDFYPPFSRRATSGGGAAYMPRTREQFDAEQSPTDESAAIGSSMICPGCGERVTLDWADGWRNDNGFTCQPHNTTHSQHILVSPTDESEA